MPTIQDPQAARQLQTQIAKLEGQLRTCRQRMEQMETRHAEAIDVAAQTGYELGFMEAEEKELRREQAIAEAVVVFEKAYAKKAKFAFTATAAAATPTAARQAGKKRRGRPAQVTAPIVNKTAAPKRPKRSSRKRAQQAISAPTFEEALQPVAAADAEAQVTTFKD